MCDSNPYNSQHTFRAHSRPVMGSRNMCASELQTRTTHYNATSSTSRLLDYPQNDSSILLRGSRRTSTIGGHLSHRNSVSTSEPPQEQACYDANGREVYNHCSRDDDAARLSKPVSVYGGDPKSRETHFNTNVRISPSAANRVPTNTIPDTYRGNTHHSMITTASSSTDITGDPKGFKNLGNTCYLNATIQCILSSPFFISYLKKSPKLSSNKFKKLHWDFIELADARSGDVPTLLRAIKSRVTERNSEFMGASQNDAHEFLRVVLLLLHEELNLVENNVYQEMVDIPYENDYDAAKRWIKYLKSQDNSVVYDIFGGLMKTVTLCERCNYRALNFDPFLDISIPIPRKLFPKRISDVFHAFTASEALRDLDRFICPKCRKQVDSRRQRTVYTWPNNLVIHLARFDNKGAKNDIDIEIERYLTIDKDWCGDSEFNYAVMQKLNNNRSEGKGVYEGDYYQYELYGVVIHTGSQYSGHYYSYVKNTTWWCCDDNKIEVCDLYKVLRDGSRGGYILFYRKKW